MDLEYIFHHLFLPFNLPQKDDDGVVNDVKLARITKHCAARYEEVAAEARHGLSRSWRLIPGMLRRLTPLAEFLDEENLYNVFNGLVTDGKPIFFVTTVAILTIKSQTCFLY